MKTDLEHFKQHFSSVKDREIRVASHARITSLSWSCDGSKLAVASSDGSVRLSDLSSGEPRELCKLFQVGKNFSVAFHPIVPNILVCCDARLLVYDTASHILISESEVDFPSRPLNIAFNKDGSLIAVGTKAEELHFFTLSANYTLSLAHIYKCAFECNQFAFTLDNNLLLATGPGTLRLLSNDGTTILKEINCANGPLQSLTHCPEYTITGSSDATISIFSSDLHLQSIISRPEWPISHLTLSHDHQFLAAGGDDRHLDISCMPTGELVHKLSLDGSVLACRWHPTKYLLAYAPERVDKNGRPEWIVKIFGYPN